MENLRNRNEPTQKRILALDGGGLRGVITVEVLHRIERLLREQTSTPDLRLCDWFDFIAGTSTGAVSAALLSTGHTAAEVRTFYEEEPAALFRPAALTDRFHHRWDAGHFAHRLQEVFGIGTTLGSPALKTLVLFVLRNATTDSPWFITNNPSARFNDRAFKGCNLNLPLWQLVRASTAAPTLFEPETILVGDEAFIFADGALTGYNNPAFKAFLLATAEPYGLSWPTGEDRMLVVSVGTGTPSLADPGLDPEEMHLLYHAQSLPFALLNATAFQQDLLCRVFGDCRVGDRLDMEVGDLIGARGPVEPKLFTYLRYDCPLSSQGLTSIGCGDIDARRLHRLDDTALIQDLQRVGRALADTRVLDAHFEHFLA